jgi:hypothetical protein
MSAGADDGQMSSAPAISRCPQACARHRWEVSGRCDSAVGTCASSRIIGQVRAVNGSRAL